MKKNVYDNSFYTEEIKNMVCVDTDISNNISTNASTTKSTTKSTAKSTNKPTDKLTDKLTNVISNIILCSGSNTNDIINCLNLLDEINKSNKDNQLKDNQLKDNKLKDKFTYQTISLYDETTFSIPIHLKHKFKNLATSDVAQLLNGLKCIMWSDKLNLDDQRKLIIGPSTDKNEFNFLNTINDQTVIDFINTADYDMLFFEQFENMDYVGLNNTESNCTNSNTNSIIPLSEINKNNLSYKCYICKRSAIDKINAMLEYSEQLEQLYFNNKQVTVFNTYILDKLNVYVYGSKFLLEKTKLNKNKKTIGKPYFDNKLIDSNKIKLEMFSLI